MFNESEIAKYNDAHLKKYLIKMMIFSKEPLNDFAIQTINKSVTQANLN